MSLHIGHPGDGSHVIHTMGLPVHAGFKFGVSVNEETARIAVVGGGIPAKMAIATAMATKIHNAHLIAVDFSRVHARLGSMGKA